MRISNTIIHSAILLCSTMVPRDHSLDAFTAQYLQDKNLPVDPSVVATNIEKYNKGAKLYVAYRGNLDRVEKKGLLQEVYRYTWIYKLVACTYNTLTPQQLLRILDNKYNEEKISDEFLDRDRFGAFKLIDREFCTKDAIIGNGKFIARFSDDLDKALNQFANVFSSLEDFEYMADIYTLEAISEISEAESNNQPVIQFSEPTSFKPVQDYVQGKKRTVAVPESSAPGDDMVATSEIELRLRDEIKILRKDKHNLEVKLSFAKKDAVREFLCALTDYGHNCPLSELYRLLYDDETPEKIKGIINNLFTALGSENVKLTRDKIGDEITLTEDNIRIYGMYGYEKLKLGDTAEIFYPGYRYDREVMVRPVVREIKNAEEKPDENG